MAAATPDPCRDAAVLGDLNALTKALENGAPLTLDAALAAAAAGRVDMLQRMKCLRCSEMSELTSQDESIPCKAAGSGQIDVLEWHRCNHFPARAYSASVASAAAAGGHIPTLEWLYERHYVGDATTCAAAAGGGYIGTVQWLRDRDCDWDTNTCAQAAYGGHTEILKYAVDHGVKMDSYTPTRAAAGGHPEIVLWAIRNGAPADEHTCGAALANGDTALVQQLMTHGLPHGAGSLRAATLSGRVDMVEWFCSAYTVQPTRDTFKAAVEGGHMPMLEWLLARKCPWDENLCTAAAWTGSLDILQWLRANGCPWDAELCYTWACKGKHGNVAAWVMANGCDASSEARGDARPAKRCKTNTSAVLDGSSSSGTNGDVPTEITAHDDANPSTAATISRKEAIGLYRWYQLVDMQQVSHIGDEGTSYCWDEMRKIKSMKREDFLKDSHLINLVAAVQMQYQKGFTGRARRAPEPK